MASDDRGQAIDPALPAALLVGLSVAIMVGYQILTMSTTQVKTFTAHAHEWCTRENGSLYNAQVVGEHGGLHCQLPSGQLVDMQTVARHDWTHNLTQLQTLDHSPYNTFLGGDPWTLLAVILSVFTAVGLVGLGLRHYHHRGDNT